MAVLMPHVFDMAEFKREIVLRDALACWSRNGSSSGQPYDLRNWEAAPWFLQKWKMLVDGEEGQIWKQSSWWWAVTDTVQVTQ